MQTITHYIKLFAIFMTMTLFSSYLYGADIHTLSKVKNTNNNIKIISSEKEEEGDKLIHHVTLRKKENSARNYTFSIVDGTAKSGLDYNPIPTFDSNSSIKFSKGKVNVPAGVDKFNIYIETKSDEIRVEQAETYTVTLGSKSAKGTIINVDE